MVTCKIYGGTCNNMFQIAATIGYAKKWGMDYYIPTTVTNPHHKNSVPFLFRNVHYSDRQLSLPVYTEPSFEYSEIPYMRHLCINGYFQSALFFDDYREEILKSFGLEYGFYKDVVSVHVRRGDYLTLQRFHPVITKEYIESAMKLFPGKEFCFFSDDHQWVKDNFGHRDDCQVESSNNAIQDLVNASCCEHNIGSNSSYSWWIHYLNRNESKKGVFPSNWFGPDLPHNTKDLYPKNCIIL